MARSCKGAARHRLSKGSAREQARALNDRFASCICESKPVLRTPWCNVDLFQLLARLCAARHLYVNKSCENDLGWCASEIFRLLSRSGNRLPHEGTIVEHANPANVLAPTRDQRTCIGGQSGRPTNPHYTCLKRASSAFLSFLRIMNIGREKRG